MPNNPPSQEPQFRTGLMKKPFELSSALTTTDTDPNGLFFLISSCKLWVLPVLVQKWRSNLFDPSAVSRPFWYPRAHALHLCASACLEGKRLGRGKWENELSRGAISTVRQICRTGCRECGHTIQVHTSAMTFHKAESPDLRNHREKNPTTQNRTTQYLLLGNNT